MIRKGFSLLVVVLVLMGCTGTHTTKLDNEPALLPLPKQVSWGEGVAYTLPTSAVIVTEGEVPQLLIEQINNALTEAHLATVEVTATPTEKPSITLRIAPDLQLAPSGYKLTSAPESGVLIEASSPEGLAYGVQTLRQIITPKGIASAMIEDEAYLPYRGLMLDVSRHYMSVDFIKQLLDEMQRYKLNRFHWHLVDAGGWRLQLDKYPELTQKTAFRTESDWDKWWVGKDRQYLDEGQGGYGGYYTAEEAREIVSYAAERGIVVIPEIEMPGHSEEVLYTYPQLSCSGKALPHESDFCVGNPQTFAFLKGVLEEVMQIFPSQYIHIGGDEAGKRAWGTCPKCQALMRQKGMKHIDELQSYLIHEIEIFLNSKGRQLIGWDEILEGGLAPNATVMSWRGEDGGKQAAKAGHQVVMTPNSHFYLDYYQEDPTKATREAIGGYLPLEKVYSYNPLPPDLTPEEQKLIVGVQGNLWTEYVLDDDHAAYMLFPRALAIAEVGWTQPELRSWQNFRIRVNQHIPELQARGVNSYSLSNQLIVDNEVDYEQKAIYLSMSTERFPHEIRYTLNGTTPSATSPIYHEGERIEVRDSALLVAGLFENGNLIGDPTTFRADYHKGIGKKVQWQSPLGGGYPAGGVETALLDGVRGSITYMDKRWLGNVASQSTIGIIDLGAPTELTHLFTKCMHDTDPWVYMPEWVEVSVSADGTNYQVVDRVYSQTDPNDTWLRFETFHFYPATTARYIKIEYHLAEAGKFLFTDELVIW